MAALAGRGLFALGLLLAAGSARAELPRDATTMTDAIRTAIEERDYERFEELVLWKDVGKIKRRVVAFQIRRGLGRQIDSVTLEDLDQEAVRQMLANGRHKLNMPVSQKVRVVYAEDAINEGGKKPTSVFLIGQHKDAFRIGVVVRNFEGDDDD